MSPFEIVIALHYYVSTTDYSGEGRDSNAFVEIRDKFLLCDFLVPTGENNSMFKGTKKLDAYCNALCDVELPVQVWVQP